MTGGSVRVARGLVVAVLFLSAAARADTPGEHVAQAEALFRRARALATQGKYVDACPLFAESQRLDPAVGTLINLAECYEKTGRTTSAWGAFRDAADAAEKAGQQDRVRYANVHASALDRRIAKLTLHVAPAARAQPGLEVRVDGVVRPEATWETALPIDPGRHVLEARAPGRGTWSSPVQLAEGEVEAHVTVPELPPLAPAAAAPPSRSRALSIVGWTTASLGVVGLGVGAYFGLAALQKKNHANADGHCTDTCDAAGKQDELDAHAAARGSNVGFVVGAVLLAAGITLVVLDAPRAPSGVAMRVGPDGVAVRW
jgi:hypothetical protein